MFNKKQVQESIKRIDNAIAQLNGNRQTHVTLVNDIALVQKVCMDYFEAMETVGQAKQPMALEQKLVEAVKENNNERTDKSA